MHEIKIVYRKSFRKSLKRMDKRKKNLGKLWVLVNLLIHQKTVPLNPKFKDHALKGKWVGYRECHIEPDWILVYQLKDDLLLLVDTGSHTDIFGW